jgi:acetylornithine deacetylase/succinyl-diaminopimelate desuccinylase-like protein
MLEQALTYARAHRAGHLAQLRDWLRIPSVSTLRGGGSLPIVRTMVEELSRPGTGAIPVVMIGFGLPDDRMHAPNEKFHLPNFYHGIETVFHYLDLFSQIPKKTIKSTTRRRA